jgi:hypothetical protein
MMRMKTKENLTQLEQYFQQFRKNIIGINQDFNFLRQKQIVYTVGQPVVVYTALLRRNWWIWSFVANTHTETTVSGGDD